MKSPNIFIISVFLEVKTLKTLTPNSTADICQKPESKFKTTNTILSALETGQLISVKTGMKIQNN